MCGICGGIGKLNKNVIEGLLIANESRGDHSAGVAIRDNRGYLTIIKKAVGASQFVDQVNLSAINTAQVVLGHTRWATTGAINDANAHPLTSGRVTGVHNGMISNHAQFAHGGEVDSQAIFYQLDKHISDVPSAFKPLTGSCATAWIVKGDPRLHLAKSGNPLHVAFVGDAIYFSSEYYALYSVLRGAGLHIDSIAEVKEDTALSISPDKNFSMTIEKIKMQAEVWRNSYNVTVKSGKKQKSSRYIDDWELEAERSNFDSLESFYRTLPDADAAYSIGTEQGCAICQRIFSKGDVVLYDAEDLTVYCEEDAKLCGMADLPQIVLS